MFDCDNAVIMSFFPYSGGKFLSNCLSLSRHACPQNATAVDYLLDHPGDYDYRLECVLSSLPLSSNMKRWKQHEFGDSDLYGAKQHQGWLTGKHCEINDRTRQLMESGLRFFITDHFMTQSSLNLTFPRAWTIKLVDHYDFQKKSVTLKSNMAYDGTSLNGNFCESKYEELAGPDWPHWSEFQSVGYDIGRLPNIVDAIKDEIRTFYPVTPLDRCSVVKVDDVYFDFLKFSHAVHRLFQDLGFDDFDPALLECFYDRYMELHGDLR